jgi:eukaryotic-like serine/threonine-protein kinase
VGNAYLLPPDRSVLGRVIANRYLVEGLCESTPAGASYRAYHLKLDCSVLVRILPECHSASQDACRRALATAERVSSLSNPHLARTLDVGLVEARYPFLVYEYSKGRSLAALLSHSGPFAVERLLPVARQLASALDTAHDAGVLHGRLQLEHCWLESLACRPEWLRLLGFGLAELPEVEADASSSGVFPSTARGGEGDRQLSQLGLRADIYGLGACLYQLASGTPPGWAAAPRAGLDPQIGAAPWTGTRPVERGLSLLIQRCLYLLPDRPYRAVAEISRDLEQLEGSTAEQAADPPSRRPPVTAIHAPARRARVAVGQPKVIVKGG